MALAALHTSWTLRIYSQLPGGLVMSCASSHLRISAECYSERIRSLIETETYHRRNSWCMRSLGFRPLCQLVSFTNPTNYKQLHNSKSPNSLRGSILHISHVLFYLLPQRMPPNASWSFIPEYGPPPSRKHSRFSLFSANLGAGWHMLLPLAIALHTLDHKSGGNNENRVLLQVSKPIRCERSFQICKVDLKFGVDISTSPGHASTRTVLPSGSTSVHQAVNIAITH